VVNPDVSVATFMLLLDISIAKVALDVASPFVARWGRVAFTGCQTW
jgi:hypothetical protein